MIKPYVCYDVECDRCGYWLSEDTEVSYESAEKAEFEAECHDWRKINGKHYCPECFDYNEETGEFLIKKGGKK